MRLDLSELRFIDSTGIALLITASRAARREGRRLEIDPAVGRQVRRVLELTGADRFLWPPDAV